MYPPEDLALTWREDTGFGPVRARKMNTDYIGGSPEQYPERYRATASLPHVRRGLAVTLIAYGEHDHLVPALGHLQLAAKLTDAGVENNLLSIPYGDHGCDLVWGGIGTQITRRVFSDFLNRHFPVRTDGATFE
jgi:acetyl esterase/lipase